MANVRFGVSPSKSNRRSFLPDSAFYSKAQHAVFGDMGAALPFSLLTNTVALSYPHLMAIYS